jgi:hypothetical protein
MEDYFTTIDQSVTSQDFVWSAIKFSMATDGIIMADPSVSERARFLRCRPAASPYFTSPTTDHFAAARGGRRHDPRQRNGCRRPDLVRSHARHRRRGAEDLRLRREKYSPDVFAGQMAVSMNLTALTSRI